MATLRPPRVSQDQIVPFTKEQFQALVAAAGRSWRPLRDRAIVRVLVDTGLRSSELCSLDIGSLDLDARPVRIKVRGKGDKDRTVYLGPKSVRSVWDYLRREGRDPHEPLFLTETGWAKGNRLTRSGLQQLIDRLAEDAEIVGVRASPHTFRHT